MSIFTRQKLWTASLLLSLHCKERLFSPNFGSFPYSMGLEVQAIHLHHGYYTASEVDKNRTQPPASNLHLLCLVLSGVTWNVSWSHLKPPTFTCFASFYQEWLEMSAGVILSLQPSPALPRSIRGNSKCQLESSDASNLQLLCFAPKGVTWNVSWSHLKPPTFNCFASLHQD